MDLKYEFNKLVDLIKQDRIDEAYEYFKRLIEDAIFTGAEAGI